MVVLWYAISLPKNQPPVVIEIPIQNATTTEPVVTATSTKDWLTYRNEEYGFEIIYPGDLTIKDWAYKTPNWELLLYLGKNKDIGDGAVSFGVEKDIKNFDAEKFFWPIPREDIKIKEATIGVNNYKAHEVAVNFHSVDGDNNTINYFIENANKLLRITYNKNKGAELSEDTFKMILSNLKFIK